MTRTESAISAARSTDMNHGQYMNALNACIAVEGEESPTRANTPRSDAAVNAVTANAEKRNKAIIFAAEVLRRPFLEVSITFSAPSDWSPSTAIGAMSMMNASMKTLRPAKLKNLSHP